MANEFKVKNGLKVGNTEIIDSNGQIDWGRLKNKVTAVAGSSNGLLSSSDKSKLDGIDSGAQVNQTITAGTGLSGGGSTDSLSINLSHLGIDGLTDPNDDRIMFWDDSAGASQWLDLGSNLSISGTTISSTNTTYSVGDGGLTQKNFTTADNTKLDGIEASADVTDTTNVVAALTAGTNVAIAADGTISSTDTDTWRGIQDNLTSTSTTDSLSAKQGKELKTLVDGKASSSHTHSYLPLSGGTVTGTITQEKDGVAWSHGEAIERPLSKKLISEVSHTGITGANITDVYGEADVTGIKNHTTFTYAEAWDAVEAEGGRLPTLAELQDGAGMGSGQGYDSELLWTCTPAGPHHVWVCYGAYADGTHPEPVIVDITNISNEYRTRCFWDVSRDGRQMHYAHDGNAYVGDNRVLTTDDNQALADVDALSISDHSITLTKGDGTTETVTVPDNNTTYSVGDGGLTQKNFTTTLKNKLDGIASGATNVTNNNQLTNGAGYITAHPSITEAADVNNSNGTVIQDLTFDDNGHVTATGSVNLDGRYYTETEIDNELDTLSASLRANTNITGGGTITVNSSGYIKNSARFIVIANGRGTHFATNGYFDINIPTSGTVTGVGGSANKTATSNGVPLDTWEALYYILPVGSSSGSVAANFRVADYTSNAVIPETWVLLAIRNGDSGQKVWVINKYGLELGQSVNTTVYDARYAQYAASAGDADTVNGKTVDKNVPSDAVFTDNNTTYSVGDGGLTQKNFTTTLKNKLDGIAASANNYSHPTYNGDDFSIDTGHLSGATVIDDLDINITTDGQGHVTDANATVATRNLTLADLGYTGATNANNYSLPAQSGHSGKYLTTDGSGASWSDIAVAAAHTTYQLFRDTITDHLKFESGVTSVNHDRTNAWWMGHSESLSVNANGHLILTY